MHHFTEMFCLPSYTQSVGLFATLFIAGFLGGVMHCSGMCGGFGLSFSAIRYSNIPPHNLSEKRRFFESILLPYHLGRIFTYSMLGFLSAFFASLISSFNYFETLRTAILLIALWFFIVSSFSLSGIFPKKFKGINNSFYFSFISKISQKFFSKPYGLNLFFSGVVLGFLPCAMVYSSMLASAASANPLTGALISLFFGLGTIFPLILTTYGLGFFIKKLKGNFRKTTSILMALNSLVLVIIILVS
jgi:hypothetical protein